MDSITRADHIESAKRSASKEWDNFVVRCVISNMQNLAQKTGIVPKSFCVYGSTDNPLRVLLREFGWDV